MIDCTHKQLIDVWLELDNARVSKNGYGGDVAEIYLYTVQASSPLLDNLKRAPGISSPHLGEYEQRREDSVRTIYEICKLFAQKMDVQIWVEDYTESEFHKLSWNMDDREHDDSWILDLDHRMHVKVV